jgi:hypothetical protein
MKKIVRNYFLFFSRHPIWFHFWPIASVLLFITFFDLIFNCTADGNLSDSAIWKSIPGRYIFLFFVVVIAHIISIYLIASVFITRKMNDILDPEYCCNEAVLLSDGTVIALGGPIWAQGKKYYFDSDAQLWHFRNGFKVQTVIIGKYGNSSITLPVTLDIKTNAHFNELEVFKVLIKEQPGDDGVTRSSVSMKNYIINVFAKVNKGNQEVINWAAGKYSQRLMSEPQLLNEIIEVLIFPERIFSNVEDVKICLGSPTFSSCKGMSCGTEVEG